MPQAQDQRDRGKADNPGEAPPLWERVVAALGLLLVLATLGFLLYEGIWGGQAPPDVNVEPQGIFESGESYLVEFKARNDGDQTAANVRITGVLVRDGQVLEQAEVTMDYVPAGSMQAGGLYFRNDPRRGELTLGASGYQVP